MSRRRTPIAVRVIPYAAAPSPKTTGALALSPVSLAGRPTPPGKGRRQGVFGETAARPGAPVGSAAAGRRMAPTPVSGGGVTGEAARGGAPVKPLPSAAPRPPLRPVEAGGKGRVVLSAVDGRGADEDMAATLGAVVRLIGEVLAGVRPVRQLARRATMNVCRELAPHVPSVRAGAQVRPPKVITTWAQTPAPGAVEGGAVIALNGRVQAFALRLELHRGRWLCTALETTTPAP